MLHRSNVAKLFQNAHAVGLGVELIQIIDHDGLKLQLEGGALQSLSFTLYEEVTYDSGGITSRDWDTYPILRFDEAPEVDTILIDRPGEPYLGPSECSVPPTADSSFTLTCSCFETGSWSRTQTVCGVSRRFSTSMR